MKYANRCVNLWLLAFYTLIVYLVYFQGHELGHSIIALIFGSRSLVYPCQVTFLTALSGWYPWSEVLTSLGGYLAGFLVAILGNVLLHRASGRFWKQTGYSLGLIVPCMNIGYEVLGTLRLLPLIGGTYSLDSTYVANYLGLSEYLTRILLIVINCSLLLCILVNDRKTHYTNVRNGAHIGLGIGLGSGFTVLFNLVVIWLVQKGDMLAQPIFMFPAIVLIVDLVIGILLFYSLRHKGALNSMKESPFEKP